MHWQKHIREDLRHCIDKLLCQFCDEHLKFEEFLRYVKLFACDDDDHLKNERRFT